MDIVDELNEAVEWVKQHSWVPNPYTPEEIRALSGAPWDKKETTCFLSSTSTTQSTSEGPE